MYKMKISKENCKGCSIFEEQTEEIKENMIKYNE